MLAPKISKATGLKNRGAKTAQFEALTCKASIPAVLCEGGFMDSTIDEPVITSEKGQRAYAKAVADGVIEYLKLEKKESSAENKIGNVETKPAVDNTMAEEETKSTENSHKNILMQILDLLKQLINSLFK